jgi:hypothetical protein
MEAAVAFNIHRATLNIESLGDGRFHLSYSPLLFRVQVNKRAILAVHDEVATFAAFFGYPDEFIHTETTTPC